MSFRIRSMCNMLCPQQRMASQVQTISQISPISCIEKLGFRIACPGFVLYNVVGSGVEWGEVGRETTLPPNTRRGWGSEFMFLGQYSYTLDSKGRLTIPSRYREELPVEVVLTRGLDRCLVVYPIDVWEEISQKVTSLPITDPRGRTLRRVFFADAISAELDRQGRMLIPDRLRNYAGLELSSEVAIVGLDRFIELWSPRRWEEVNQSQIDVIDEDPALWENLHI